MVRWFRLIEGLWVMGGEVVEDMMMSFFVSRGICVRLILVGGVVLDCVMSVMLIVFIVSCLISRCDLFLVRCRLMLG